MVKKAEFTLGAKAEPKMGKALKEAGVEVTPPQAPVKPMHQTPEGREFSFKSVTLPTFLFGDTVRLLSTNVVGKVTGRVYNLGITPRVEVEYRADDGKGEIHSYEVDVTAVELVEATTEPQPVMQYTPLLVGDLAEDITTDLLMTLLTRYETSNGCVSFIGAPYLEKKGALQKLMNKTGKVPSNKLVPSHLLVLVEEDHLGIREAYPNSIVSSPKELWGLPVPYGTRRTVPVTSPESGPPATTRRAGPLVGSVKNL